MKILQLAQFLPPVAGGEERHVWNLARSLAARSHEVTLLGFATDGAPAGTSVIDGIRAVRVRSAASRLPALYSDLSRPHALPLPDPEVSRAIAREFAVGRYDVAHAHNWIVNSALRPAAKAAVPLVMTLHDYSHVCATKRLMEHGRNQCPGPGLRRCLSCASGHYGPLNGAITVAANAAAAHRRARRLSEVAAVSSAVADAVAIPPDHWLHRAGLSARVIPNFIPDDVVVHEIAPARPGAPFLFAGDLTADKGVPVLLDAYRRLEAPPELILAGRIPGPVEWRFPPGARWVGQLPHEDMFGLFRSARAVVVPSVWSDPCPTVVLEAMAAGRPVVGSASGGIVDMVVDGQTGLLVPPGDAIALAEALATLLRQPESARAFGVAGRDRVRRFTVNAVVARIEQMYSDAIESGAAGWPR